jgi:TonB family protein
LRATLHILFFVFAGLFGCATPSHPSPRELEVTHTLTERCSEDRALDCYQRGLSLGKEPTTVGERSEAVSLISEACAAKITAACETFTQRFKPPRRIAGRFPHYTKEAFRLGLHGQISVKCTIVETGILRDCRVLPSLSDDEQRLLVQSNFDKELLGAFATWRFTPALFDDAPIDFDHVFHVKMTIE